MAAPSGTADVAVLPDLATARDHVAAAALHPTPVGHVGLELEAHLVDLVDPAARVPWDRVQAALATVPPLPGGSIVTVEPGGQVELSGPPQPGVVAAVAAAREDDALVRAVLRPAGLGLAALGADPYRPPRRISPGPRYAAMEEHFSGVGCHRPGLVMMTSTASLQVNLEAARRAAGPTGCGWHMRWVRCWWRSPPARRCWPAGPRAGAPPGSACGVSWTGAGAHRCRGAPIR